jgi:hypothetical protein
MLADTCEAAVRAMRPASREELELMVDRLIDERIASGELNESNLTFRELQTVKEVFLHVLQGVHHPRIRYPDNVKAPAPEAATTAPTPANGASAPPYIPPRRELGGVEEPAPAINYPAAMDG